MGQGRTGGPDGSLLLILPLPVCQHEGRIFIEHQAANGLHQWLLHFRRVTLGVKLIPGPPAQDSVAIEALALGGNLTLFLMPPAWTPLSFLRAYPAMRRKLSSLIDSHDYLHFALGGAWGDWAAIGALLASKRGRRASVWTDRVESEVMRIDADRATGVRRAFRHFSARVAKRLERRAIRASTLGLFHGKDCYEAYRRFSANPFLVHDIHLKAADRISEERLAAKIAVAMSGPLNLVYVGRVHPDKGAMDWIEALRIVAEAGVSFHARWFGAGPQLEEARARILNLGMDDWIQFPGQLLDRGQLLDHLRAAHLMPFCHLTPESPRNLIEALASGTPIVGYASAYPEDLISAHGGGSLTQMAPSALADEIMRLSRDRSLLADLIGRASQDGAEMNDDAVFAHRSALMKQYC